ncbi:DNA polymerase III subunit delta' [Silanimonas lenta]|uniref:DNA polymerase III subunit delta' n=1 Tax=Silanimonas lenta TaxID=265429 RepID=UPI002FE2977F
MEPRPLAPWQQQRLDAALAAWRAGRLGHAQLLCGPEAIGKRAVAEALTARLLCEAAPALPACGECRSCRLLAAGSHPDFRLVTFEVNENTDKLRRELVVEQVRALSGSMQMTAQRGGAQVVLIDPADALNTAAANALLKTLEEPAPNRFLLLLSAEPQRLPATIRSRCQRLEFALPPRAEALAWLEAGGHAPARAAEALEAAAGHPGLADAWLRGGGLALREATLKEWAAVARGIASPLTTAQHWFAEPETAPLRLRFVADATLALARAAAGAPAPLGLTPPGDLDKLARWFDSLNRLRQQLAAPLRHELALAGLLAEWRALMATTETRR